MVKTKCKTKWLFVLAGLIVVALIGDCATPTLYAKPIRIEFSTVFPPTHHLCKNYIRPLCEEITKRTSNRVTFRIHYAGALGKATEQFDVIKSGLAHITDVATTYNPGKFSLSVMGTLPFAASNSLNRAKAMQKMQEKGWFDKEFREVELITFNSNAAYDWLFRKGKPMKIQDIAGIKVRAPGGYISQFLEDIGMVTVLVPGPQIYESFDKRMLECVAWQLGTMHSYKLTEIKASSLCEIDYAHYGSTAMIFNKDLWAKLPSDIKKIIREAFLEYRAKWLNSYAIAEPGARKAFRAAGVEFYTFPDSELDKLRKAAAKTWDKFVSDTANANGKEALAEFTKILESLGEKTPYSR